MLSMLRGDRFCIRSATGERTTLGIGALRLRIVGEFRAMCMILGINRIRDVPGTVMLQRSSRMQADG